MLHRQSIEARNWRPWAIPWWPKLGTWWDSKRWEVFAKYPKKPTLFGLPGPWRYESHASWLLQKTCLKICSSKILPGMNCSCSSLLGHVTHTNISNFHRSKHVRKTLKASKRNHLKNSPQKWSPRQYYNNMASYHIRIIEHTLAKPHIICRCKRPVSRGCHH